ncbi:porin [Vibrio sinaloensis]|uniref:porin n=1 Tax=Photobacterium sp. (strain ATCC 43367) TaxID=379097 RepID=UPI002048B3DC|nr:porin [Vibrio sinaloensis]UPQ87033.1 porin [Vibrio sinaloensis]
MKKTLVALSVLAAASAQAGIEVYNQDGVTVNLKGDIEVVYKKGTAKDSEFTQEIQDADFGFDVRYAMNDEVSFGGYWEFDGASSDVTAGKDSYAKVGDAYVAFYTNSYGSIKFGRTCGALDDAGVGSDYQFGITSFFNNDSSFCADEMVRYDFDNGSFYATVALAQDEKNVDRMGKDGHYVDGKLGYRVAGFDFTAYYAQADLSAKAASTEFRLITADDVTKGLDVDGVGAGNYGKATISAKPQTDEKLMALEARYSGVENLGLGLGYYTVEVKPAAGTKVDADVIALGVDYTVSGVKLAAGYDIVDVDGAAKKTKNWFLNAGYGIAPSTTAYVEVGGNNKDNSETGVAVGVKASF